MKLYYAPLTCSLAVRIACYEARIPISYVRVDTKAKRTEEGVDFGTIHPVGMVPVLELDDGQRLTEVAAVLQYLAALSPDAELARGDTLGRARLQQWLSFIGMELQKAVYTPVLDQAAPQAAKDYALTKAAPRLAWIAAALEASPYLLGRFSIADAYLFSILNWSLVAPVDLKPWSALDAFMKRMHARPAVARAFAEEKDLYFGNQVPRAATR